MYLVTWRLQIFDIKNTSSELDNQSEVFCQVMTYYFTTRHLVVLGYSGRDNSLMSALKIHLPLPGPADYIGVE